jgi:hypothetical protein
MFGKPSWPDAAKLTPPRQGHPATPPAPDFLQFLPNHSTGGQSVPAEAGPDADVDVRWDDEEPAGDPVPLRSAQDTPFPDVPLQWPLIVSTPAAPAPAPAPAPVQPTLTRCPGCGGELTVAGKTWCLRCGYNSDQPQRVFVPAEGGVAQAAVVLAFAAVGCLAIISASIFRKDLVPDRTDLRVWWIGFEGAVGFLVYCIGHATAVALTARFWPDDKPSIFDPLAVWRYALYHLPGTRWAVTLGVWGGTAFLCAFALFCLNDFVIKDKTAKPPIRAAKHGSSSSGPGQAADAPESKATGHGKSGEDQSVEERAAAPAGEADKRPAGRSEVAEIDPSLADAPRLRPRSQKGTAVVIGYVPDKNDPTRVSQVMLGTRGPDGTIRYAGVAQVDKAFEQAGGVGRLKALPPPAATPGYALSKHVVPVEPKLLADIKYVEQDSRGIFKDTVVTGVEGEDRGNRPKQ